LIPRGKTGKAVRRRANISRAEEDPVADTEVAAAVGEEEVAEVAAGEDSNRLLDVKIS
jgi:hypothetical protein